MEGDINVTLHATQVERHLDGRLGLKTEESTLHSELRRFLDFHCLRSQGGRDPFGLQFDFRNSGALGRAGPGRTRPASFHSNGQPSVAIILGFMVIE